MKEIFVNSETEAFEKCIELTRSGINLFRGQFRDFRTIIPSAHRVIKPQNNLSIDTINEFINWAKAVPELIEYRSDEILTAIGQHYGMPTNYLDLTRNPKIAILFSKATDEFQLPSESVIYCFRKEDLLKVSEIKILEFDVKNLWRLEIQEGLFLEFLINGCGEKVFEESIRIHFPCTKMSEEEHSFIYPQRKSSLESQIDNWLYYNEIHAMRSVSDDQGIDVFAKVGEDNISYYKERKIQKPEQKWLQYSYQWLIHRREHISVAGKQNQICIPPIDLSNIVESKRLLSAYILNSLMVNSSIESLTFKLDSSSSSKHLQNVTKIINRAWDSMRVMPYTYEEMANSLSLIILFIVARAEGLPNLELWPEKLWGRTQILKMRPFMGGTMAGICSCNDFCDAIELSESYLKSLVNYAQKCVSKERLTVFKFTDDPSHIFDFDKFRSLFIEQIIPTAIFDYWDTDLDLYSGSLKSVWKISFNALALHSISIEEYDTLRPVTKHTVSCYYEKRITIPKDASKNDIAEILVHCIPNANLQGLRYIIEFDGHHETSQEVWEIPSIIQQSKWIIELGGLILLRLEPCGYSYESMSPNASVYDEDYRNGLGAFEIWAIANSFYLNKNPRGLVRSPDDTKHFLQDYNCSVEKLNAQVNKIIL